MNQTLLGGRQRFCGGGEPVLVLEAFVGSSWVMMEEIEEGMKDLARRYL